MKGLPSNQLIRAALRPVVMSVGAGNGEVCVCVRERGRQANLHQSSTSSHTAHVLRCFSRPPLRNPPQPSHSVRVRVCVHVRVQASINKVGVCIQDPKGESVRHRVLLQHRQVPVVVWAWPWRAPPLQRPAPVSVTRIGARPGP